ncbi:Hypothetical predicted protein [Pelobates cultripes]|uniref:Uncharacterized protein n=1 Tax=Pelobates cultripes TaxID=61616 RepID=A0AAD1WYF9_PELCU|nr:Hypothetical predicted protein [Pelobates cultripes]
MVTVLKHSPGSTTDPLLSWKDAFCAKFDHIYARFWQQIKARALQSTTADMHQPSDDTGVCTSLSEPGTLKGPYPERQPYTRGPPPHVWDAYPNTEVSGHRAVVPVKVWS